MRSIVGSIGLVIVVVGGVGGSVAGLGACGGDKQQVPAGKAPASGTPTAATSTAPAPAVDAAAEGPRVVGELKRRLVGRLTEALKVSPASAIEVCNTEAPAIAAGLATGGVTVGRATRKPRNPANLAAGWQAEALAAFEQRAQAGTLAGATWTKTLPDGSTAYAEPLVIQPLCVTCHGPADALAPDVAQALAARYPADQATGYAPGELRGIAWAAIPPRPR